MLQINQSKHGVIVDDLAKCGQNGCEPEYFFDGECHDCTKDYFFDGKFHDCKQGEPNMCPHGLQDLTQVPISSDGPSFNKTIPHETSYH